jgi:signal transduction histidine kinase
LFKSNLMRYATLFLSILFMSCFGLLTKAQQPYFSYSMKRLSQDDGLSQGSNYFRYEDSKGFMWITGNDALNRYDGSTIKVYNLNRYFKDCPPLQQGYGFAEDDEANVYIGSVNGLYIYHRKTDKFTLQKIYANSSENLAIPFAFKDGKIWCFNKKYEIAAYTVASGKTNNILKVSLPVINSVHVYDMLGLDGFSLYYRFPFFDNNSDLWFFGVEEIYKFNRRNKSLQRFECNAIKANHALILCTYFNKQHNELLIGTDKGLVLYNISSRQERFIQSVGRFTLREVNSIACKGDVIALRCTSGTLLSDWTFTRYCWANYPSKIFSRRVYDFGFDKAGRLWMCDDGLGQAIYSFSQPLLSKIPGNNNDFTKLKEKGVGGFAEMPNGDILFQNDFLLEHSKRQLKMLRSICATLGYKQGYKTETDLVQKGIWMYGLDNDRRRLKIYFVRKSETPVLKHVIPVSNHLGACNTLKILSDGRILISFSNGLFWLKQKNLVPIRTIPGKSFFTISSLSNNRYAVSYLNKDMLLVKTDSTDDIKFVRTILPGVQSFYTQEDTGRHQYWVGTNKGIYLLDKNFKIVQHFDANNGLAGTYIYGLLLDNEGNAWCSHQRGLSSIDAHTLQITNYDKDDGIQDWDFNNRAFYKATDGTLYFGGVGGFNYFKPPLKPVSYYDPEVYIDEILVNNNIFQPDSNANEIKELHLSHRDNNIVLKAIVKDLDNTCELIYKLRESDVQWKHLPGKSMLTFNSLAPGNYMLELGVFDKYRHQNLRQKTIHIFIEAPFYLRPWFWVIVAILVTAIIAWRYHRIKLLKQKTAFRQQLALEKQRNKITADLHDDIGASLSSLQVNSIVAHELLHHHPDRAQKVLEKIASQSKNLSESIGDIIWSMKPGKDEFMTMSSRIRNFANDIMGDTHIHYQINIDEEANSQITDITVRKNIVFITKEAINNVVKYSKATTLLVTLNMEPDNVVLNIRDNGIGFEPRLQGGNGIANMKRRAEEIAGEWKLETAPKQGTRINIKIPLQKQQNT